MQCMVSVFGSLIALCKIIHVGRPVTGQLMHCMGELCCRLVTLKCGCHGSTSRYCVARLTIEIVPVAFVYLITYLVL